MAYKEPERTSTTDRHRTYATATLFLAHRGFKRQGIILPQRLGVLGPSISAAKELSARVTEIRAAITSEPWMAKKSV